MIKLNNDSVYVKGAVNGAIYDFSNGNIYSINKSACDVIDKIMSKESLNAKEKEYANTLVKNGLIDIDYNFEKYTPITTDFNFGTCWLEITQGCNCRCLHCYEGNIHRKSDDCLSINEWFGAIDQLIESGFKRFVVIGGEPCVSDYVDEILLYVSGKGGDVTLFTNGTLISPELNELILNNNIRVKFSIYGHNASVHDNITQHPGSFDTLLKNMKYLIEKNVDVSASVIIMKENEGYYQDILKFLDNLGIEYKFDVIREVFGGCQSQHTPTNMNVVKKFYRTSPRFPKITRKHFDLAINHNTCWFGKIVICEDGSVLPCVFERNNILGNIKNKSIKDILNSSNLKKCWEFSIDKVENCKQCEFRFGCKDCRPLASACGNINAKNPRCTYDANSGEWL